MSTGPGNVSLWRHRDFLFLWSGQTVNLFGSQVSWLAVPLVAITLHATEFEVAALSAAAAFPLLLVSLPAGAVVDRTRRRPLMVTCSLGCAVATGSIPIASAAGHVTLVQLYLVAALVGALSAFFDSAAATMPPVLLGRERLVDANGKMNTARGLAEMAGPSAGGYLVGLLGAARAVGVDAASYLFSAATVAFMQVREPKREPRPPGTRLTAEIAAGLRLVLTHPLLRTLVLSNGTATVLLAGVNSIWLLYVITELHWSAQVAGLVYGLSLVGGVLGSMIAKPLIDRIGMSTAMIVGALLAPLEAVTALVSPGRAGQWIVAAAFTVLTAAGMVTMTATMSVRQLICPPEMLGRVNATNRLLGQGPRFLGPLGAGGLAGWLGLRPALLLFAGSTLLWALILILSPVRTMREVPVHETRTGEQRTLAAGERVNP